MTLHALLALLAGLIAIAPTTPVAAEEIYRCGANGAAYSQTPCAEGRRVEVADTRSDEQRSQAREVAARAEVLGTALRRDRLATEAAYRPTLAGSFNSPVRKNEGDSQRSRSKIKKLHVTSKPAAHRASTAQRDGVLARPRE